MESNVCKVLLALLLGSVAATSVLAEPASTDVFEARAYRVDRAAPQQSTFAPMVRNAWDYGEAIPYSERQEDLLLRSSDPLAVWFPSDAMATSAGGPRVYYNGMPQIDDSSNTITLDRYHRLESLLDSHVLVGAAESGYLIGELKEGEYEFVLNDWTLPGVESNPLAGLFGPPSLTTPWTLDMNAATLEGSVRWTFSVIPEPATALLALFGIAAISRRR